jgi:uncharacterized protein
MTGFNRKIAALCAGLAIALAGCAPARPPASAPAASATPAPRGPALWKVADEDTTIYLFGTVHALPKDVDWYRGAIAEALASSQVLVTEVPMGELSKPEVQKIFIAKAQLPEGQTLRGLLDDEQRAVYEAALAKLGLPAAAFDRYEPWFAAMTLGALPLLKGGYALEAGVEKAIEAKVGAKTRDALETVEGQLEIFDGMPLEDQKAYLVSVAGQVDKVVPSMNGMVAAWADGDAERLAALLNEALDDPRLADRLLYARNRAWARWVEARLADPGTVFVAVGAGHLAGENSVQDYLIRSGTPVVRVQ